MRPPVDRGGICVHPDPALLNGLSCFAPCCSRFSGRASSRRRISTARSGSMPRGPNAPLRTRPDAMSLRPIHPKTVRSASKRRALVRRCCRHPPLSQYPLHPPSSSRCSVLSGFNARSGRMSGRAARRHTNSRPKDRLTATRIALRIPQHAAPPKKMTRFLELNTCVTCFC